MQNFCILYYLSVILLCLFLLFRGQHKRLAHHFAPIDGRSQGMELFFVAGHNAHNAVFVEIAGQIVDLQAADCKLFYAELEQGGLL